MPFHSALLEDALCSEEECEGRDGGWQERRCQMGELINVSFSVRLGADAEPPSNLLYGPIAAQQEHHQHV